MFSQTDHMDMGVLWQLIEEAWQGGQLNLQSVADLLCKFDAGNLEKFQHQLGFALHLLDREDVYLAATEEVESGDDEGPLSADGFLYFRAGIISRGEQFFDEVARNPSRLHGASISECEELLYAVEDSTGREIPFGRNVETGSWKSKWKSAGTGSQCTPAESDEWAQHWLFLVSPASDEDIDGTEASPPVYSDRALIWLQLSRIGRILYDVSRWIASTDHVRSHVERASGIEPLIEGSEVTEVRTELRPFDVVNPQDDWPVAVIPIPRDSLDQGRDQDLKKAVWEGALGAVEKWCIGDPAACNEVAQKRRQIRGG